VHMIGNFLDIIMMGYLRLLIACYRSLSGCVGAGCVLVLRAGTIWTPYVWVCGAGCVLFYALVQYGLVMSGCVGAGCVLF
jgi:hypothetical protein